MLEGSLEASVAFENALGILLLQGYSTAIRKHIASLAKWLGSLGLRGRRSHVLALIDLLIEVHIYDIRCLRVVVHH